MLILSRQRGESIQIGDDVRVTIAAIGPNQVRIGIEAPKDVEIQRTDTEAGQRLSERFTLKKRYR